LEEEENYKYAVYEKAREDLAIILEARRHRYWQNTAESQ